MNDRRAQQKYIPLRNPVVVKPSGIFREFEDGVRGCLEGGSVSRPYLKFLAERLELLRQLREVSDESYEARRKVLGSIPVVGRRRA